MAEKLRLSLIIRAVDQATKPLQSVARATAQIKRGLGSVSVKSREAGQAMTGTGMGGFIKFTAPLLAAAAAVLRSSGLVERLTGQLKGYLGSAQKATTMVANMMKFSEKTPFTLAAIGKSVRMLLAAKVPEGSIFDHLQYLGDIAAGAEMPIEDMTTILTKGMHKTKIQGEEILQMAERGIPIIDALIEQQRRAGNEVDGAMVFKAAEKGLITPDDLVEALRLLTEEGGQYHRQMEITSKDLLGLWSTMKDGVFNAAAVIGDGLRRAFGVSSLMQGFIGWLSRVSKGFREISRSHPQLIKTAFYIAGIVAVASPLLFTVGTMVLGFSALAGGAAALLGFLGPLAGALAFLMTPIGLLVGGVAVLAGLGFGVLAGWIRVPTRFQGIVNSIRNAFRGLPGWLKGEWRGILDWFRGPGEDQSIFAWLERPIAGLFDWITTAFRAVLDTMTAVVKTIDWAGSGKWIGEALRNAVSAVFEGLGAIWKPLLDGASESGIIGPIRTVLESLGDLLVSLFRAALDLLLGFMDGIFGTDLAGAADRLWSKLSEMDFLAIGREWISSLWAGAKNVWKDLAAWWSEVIHELVGFLPSWMRKGVEQDEGAAGPGPGRPPPDAGDGSAPAGGGSGSGGRPPNVVPIFGEMHPSERLAAERKSKLEATIHIKNLPAGSSVEGLKSDDPDAELKLQYGYSMGDASP